ncbi:DUF1508 domain-containing protein [Pseudarthrobacter sp. NamB4]|uniref:YegP family protein n=1 Tax=Pseudarthrobacter sp. NamB4 TaxID=2576837 RepID=UPI0010FE54E1|nr:DUF1508 domain-containing protein [Pseudarthrobacter sp. NamB4]TLM70277.1 DUF1508 domain-containing protein [Pseudarthrobacter sp. NamB4]
MAAYFELVDAPEGGYRVRLLNSAGQVVAVSVCFPTKEAATASIFQTREVAADAPMLDLSAPIDGKHDRHCAEHHVKRTA